MLRDTETASLEDLKKLTQLLKTAIETRDTESALKYTELLATNKITCTVTVQSLSGDVKEQEFCIKIHVEDKDNSGGIISLLVRHADTILDLKNKMWVLHKFPVEIQQWVIGNNLPSDSDTLRQFSLIEGSVIFLYLIHTNPGNTKATKVNEGRLLQILEQDYQHNKAHKNVKGPTSPSPNSVAAGNPNPTPERLILNPAMVNMAISEDGVEGQTLRAASINEEEAQQLSDPETLRPMEGARPKNSMGELGKIHFVQDHKKDGWTCEACTFVNQPSRPGCEICASPRPLDYRVPANYVPTDEEQRRIQLESVGEEKVKKYEDQRREEQLVQRQENFERLLAVEEQHLVSNTVEFDCPICFDTIEPGQGLVLRECLHSFCRDCLQAAVHHNEEPVIRCPYMDSETVCNAQLQQREIKSLVPAELFEKYLQRSLSTAESQERNSFHCKSPDCAGWCIYEDMVNFFQCPVCNHENCLTCKAIHTGLNCKQYQDDLMIRSKNDEAARNTQQMLENLVKSGDAMYCPGCKVIVQKKDGCDWVRCSICKLEICWVTKGPRWGPLGTGDISGGCGCRVGGRRCHPHCNNCH
ncbi:ranBP-type and C3HC4-type zinc finger-containing protein 1-like [Mizuhopecten yessoensis]|uniref:ranBP-type and C3HC4-type zinc finger-containing protein 1-like n=1 Tax=Mizuhopecten yessoensis TaxID=6573 RepID=UPI000B459E28|nr:ranBP-type and C3HC4-type zinc finger-containing protein 1-like [Mizuhopecten yessoensis]